MFRVMLYYSLNVIYIYLYIKYINIFLFKHKNKLKNNIGIIEELVVIGVIPCQRHIIIKAVSGSNARYKYRCVHCFTLQISKGGRRTGSPKGSPHYFKRRIYCAPRHLILFTYTAKRRTLLGVYRGEAWVMFFGYHASRPEGWAGLWGLALLSPNALWITC